MKGENPFISFLLQLKERKELFLHYFYNMIVC